MNDRENDDGGFQLSGDEQAWADLEAGISSHGKSYGSDFRSQLQRAICGENEDALLEEAPAAKRGRKAQRERREFITLEQFFELYDAVCFANSKGWLMNVEFTLQPGNLGIVGEREALSAFGVWMKRYRDWCSQRAIVSVYIYAWERPPGTSLHLHMQFRLPPEHQTDFVNWARSSVQSLCKPGAYASHTQPDIQLRRTATVVSQWAWFRYLIKGLSPAISLLGDGPAQALVDQIRVRTKPQGEITGKRVGSSRSIGLNARNAARKDGTFVPLGFNGDTPAEVFWGDAYLQGWLSRTVTRLF
ncbi:hypothetical protein ACVDG8_021700 [Mesorhizobium sp. ORM8.1]